MISVGSVHSPPTGEPVRAHRPGTLRRRLLATGLGGLAAALLLAGVVGHALLAASLADRQRAGALAAARTLADVVGASAPGARLGLLAAAVAPVSRDGLPAEPGRGARSLVVDRLALHAGGRVLFEAERAAGVSAAKTGATDHAAEASRAPAAPMLGRIRGMFGYGRPASRVAVALAPAGGAAAELRMTAREPGLDEELRRLDVLLAAGLLGVFVLTAPAVVVLVLRQTAPLGSLRDSVQRARAAGRSGVVAAAPPRRGRSELDTLGRAIDALGVDAAAARSRTSTANEALVQQVKARTAELSQANHQLELEAQDKDHFLRAVTHDLNAPLRNIDGLSRMLLHKHAAELSEGAVSRLERISINVKHQHELINDLLELSRLRTKAHRPVELRLGELVDEVAEGLGFDLENADIAFELRGDWPVVHAERNRFRQVFQNLIDNAIKYMMDSEERRITVEVERVRDFGADVFDGQDVYRFSVADTGRGIAEQDVEAVFRVFARSTHSGTHDVAGRGVGLACVEAIVRRYGGRVGVESTLGAGSTFWFTVPVEAVSSAAADAEAATAESPGETNIIRTAA